MATSVSGYWYVNLDYTSPSPAPRWEWTTTTSDVISKDAPDDRKENRPVTHWSEVKKGTRWRIDARTITTVGGGEVYFHSSVTLVEAMADASARGNVQVRALDGPTATTAFPGAPSPGRPGGFGTTQFVDPDHLMPVDPTEKAPAITVGSRWRIDPLTIRNIGGGHTYFHQSVTTVEVVKPNHLGATEVRALDGANPLGEKRNGGVLYGAGETQYVDPAYLTVPADSTTDTKETGPMATTYHLSPTTVLEQLAEHRAKLAAAHDEIIEGHLAKVVTEEDHRPALAHWHRQMATLVDTGEVELDDMGDVCGWTDRNREDELPERPLMDPYAQNRADNAREVKEAVLARQDAHIEFLRAVGTETVTVERPQYEIWFVALP